MNESMDKLANYLNKLIKRMQKSISCTEEWNSYLKSIQMPIFYQIIDL